MTASTQAPASLIEQLGTGEDKHGLIGKRIRVTNGAPQELPTSIFGLISGINAYDGAEGTIVHVVEEGSIFADFGDDEFIPAVGDEQRRVVAVGHNDQTEDEFEFAVIE